MIWTKIIEITMPSIVNESNHIVFAKFLMNDKLHTLLNTNIVLTYTPLIQFLPSYFHSWKREVSNTQIIGVCKLVPINEGVIFAKIN